MGRPGQGEDDERERPETGMPTFDVLFMGWGEGNPTQPANIADKLLSTDSTARYLPTYKQPPSPAYFPEAQHSLLLPLPATHVN